MATKRSKKKTVEKDIRNLNKKSNDTIAQFITNIFGTLWFLLAFLLFVAIWICWNLNFFSGSHPIDIFPFPRLELSLSIFAIFLSIAVLISQKRQARLEKINEQVEFEVNLRAEKEVTKVLEMLRRIQDKLGIEIDDPELDKMMKDLDTQKIHRQQKAAEKES